MSERQLAKAIRIVLFISLAATLLGANVALAETDPLSDLHVKDVDSTSVKVKWKPVFRGPKYEVHYREIDSDDLKHAGTTSGGSFKIKGLLPNTWYLIRVSFIDLFDDVKVEGSIKVRTARKSRKTDAERSETKPPPITCPHLPSTVAVSGYTMLTQCRVVDQSAIGRADVIEHDVVAALDIWSEVPNQVEVCFQNQGWLVFLDAAYTPRMLTPLLSYERHGMTCGLIDRAGTMVLLREPMQLNEPIVPADPAPANPLPAATVGSSPIIPLDNCLIKLVETLYLRAEPAGEIIGLVWLNSEVPVFEINGHWYKVEFEGVTGYISRYFRKIVRGSCG